MGVAHWVTTDPSGTVPSEIHTPVDSETVALTGLD